MTRLLICLALALPAIAVTLQDNGILVNIDPNIAGPVSITNRLTDETWNLEAAPPLLETASGPLELGSPTQGPATPTTVEFHFRGEAFAVILRYEVSTHTLLKTVIYRNTGSQDVQLDRVRSEQWTFRPAFQYVHEHRDPSQYRWLINLFLGSEKGGLYTGVENPIFAAVTKGSTPANTYLEMSFEPRTIVRPGESYTCDVSFLGVWKKEGIYLFKELGNLYRAVNQAKAIPSALNFDQEVLDWGAVWAMQNYMRARQPPSRQKNFYVRTVAMVGGRKTAELNQAAGFHIAFRPEHVAGSKQFVDDVASLGHIPHIEWATEWFGNGGYGYPTPDQALENATGLDVPVNPYWLEVVKYGWSKGIQTGIFETVIRNFAKSRADWKVLLKDGNPWHWSKEKLPVNCWANRDYVRWRLDVTSKAARDYRLHMAAWDAIVPADWSWLGWPEMRTECHAKNHGHPPGDIRYNVFRNILWFLDELQQQYPELYLRVASGLTTAYPWALKNLIEYHPNFYDGETGATYWTSYNFRFLSMYKSGVLLSATEKKDFEWLLLRSISTSDHFMLWPDAVGVALENKAFWTKWLTWADRNIEYLRVGRTLFREPWGDSIVASLPPALEGRLPAPQAALHGSAHVLATGGYIFVFNPSDRERVAAIPMNHWLGPIEGDQFEVSALYPTETRYGPYRRGEELHIAVPPQGSLALEIRAGARRGVRPAVPKKAPIDKAFLKFEEIPWAEITVRP